MTDFAHIPLHIRLTDRRKIDENYPAGNDARWWQMQELTARVSKARRTNRPELNGLQKELAAYVMERSPVSAIEVARHFGIETARVHTAIIGAAMVHPIWEADRNGLIYFGYLKEDEDES
jgi:hypothetical protein